MSDRFNGKDKLQIDLRDEHQTYLNKADVPPDLNDLDTYFGDVQDEYIVDSVQKVPADELRARTDQKTRKPRI